MVEQNEDDPCSDPNSDCGKAKAMVDKYIDDLLDENERGFVQSHLAACPGCNHGFEFESNFHRRIQSISPVPMPINVKENIMLALGFPGMAPPMKGSFSVLGSPDAALNTEISSKFGIPEGGIPKGEIPRSDFFGKIGDSSSESNGIDD